MNIAESRTPRFPYTVSGAAAAPVRVIRLCGVHDDPLPPVSGEFCLVSVLVEDWFSALSPWEAAPVMGDQPFGGRGRETLSFLTEDLLPRLESELGSGRHCLLAGYSLAGLFALWAGYESYCFQGVAAVSPSVWYPGWEDYAAGRTMQADAVYLSLGLREEKTRNPVMCRVGDAIRLQARRLEDAGVPSVLEWNPGNHFCDSALRTARGIDWLIRASDRSGETPPGT